MDSLFWSLLVGKFEFLFKIRVFNGIGLLVSLAYSFLDELYGLLSLKK